MKKAGVFWVFTFILIASIHFASSVTLRQVVEGGMSNDPDILNAIADYQQAQDDHQMQLLSVDTRIDEINAEITFLNAEKSYRFSLLKFYQTMANLYYGTIVESFNLETAKIDLRIAELDFNEKLNLYEKGLIVREDVEEASLTLKQEKLDLEEEILNLKEDLKELGWRTEIALDPATSSFKPSSYPSPEELVLSTDTYLEKDVEVKVCELSVERAQLELDSLDGASDYEIEKAERELSKARRILEKTRNNVLREYREKVFSLEKAYKSMDIAKKAWDVQRARFEVAKTRYEKGLISEREYLMAKKQLLSRICSYFQAEKSYVLALVDLLISMGNYEPLK